MAKQLPADCGSAHDGSPAADTSTAPTFQFDAFISYRRKDGGWHARALRRRLLEDPLPKEVLEPDARRLSVYLDQIYERATEDFFERTIKPALDSSRHLVVVQSASAAERLPNGNRNWLEREIDYFLSLPREGRGVSLAVTSGQFDGALPGDLHQRLPNVERLDLRAWRWYRPGAADDAVVTLAATLFDIPPQLMPLVRQEDAKRRAERWRHRAMLAASLAVVFAVLVILVAVFYVVADERRKVATSRLLAAEARERIDRRVDETLLLGVHAYGTSPTIEAQAVLLDALVRAPLLDRVLHGAAGQIQRVAASPDDRYVAAVDNSGTLTVWSAGSGGLVGKETVKADALIEGLDFDPRGGRLFTATPDGELDVWSVGEKSLRRSERITGAGIVQVLKVSPDGSLIVLGDMTGAVSARDVARLAVARNLGRHRSAVTSVAFGKDLVATGSLDGSVMVQRLDGSHRQEISAHEGGVFGVTFDQDGNHLITAGLDRRILRWRLADLASGAAEIATTSFRVLSLAGGAPHPIIAAGLSDGNVVIYPTLGGNGSRELRGHGDFVRGLALSPGGKRLFAGASNGRVLVWRPLGPENLVRRIFAHPSTPQALMFDPAGASLLSADLAGEVVTWRRGGTLSRRDVSDAVGTVSHLTTSANGEFIALAGDGNGVVWRTNVPSSEVAIHDAAGPIERLHFSGDDTLVAVGPKGDVVVLSWPDRAVKRKLETSIKGIVLSSALARRGERLALGSNEGQVVIVDLSRLQVVASWEAQQAAVTDLSFSHDASTLVSVGDDGYVSRWRLPSGQRIGDRLGDGRGRLFSVAYWPGRNVVATGHESGRIQLWDLDEGRTLGPPITAHDGFVQTLAFAPDGARLASSGAEGEIAVWETDPEGWVTLACAMANDLAPSTIPSLAGVTNVERPCASRTPLAPWAEASLPTGWPARRKSPVGSSIIAWLSGGGPGS